MLFCQGKYLQMMVVLQPIAFDVIICLTKLFDYYLYAVSTQETPYKSIRYDANSGMKQSGHNLALV